MSSRDIDFQVRPISDSDKSWIKGFTREVWGEEFVVIHGDIYYPHELTGYLGESSTDEIVGLITYTISDRICEIITLNSLEEGLGIGSVLLEVVKKIAQKSLCQKVSVFTTNDNTRALAFYQLNGFELVAIHKNAVGRSRKMKPSIPERSSNGILICDEIELEWIL